MNGQTFRGLLNDLKRRPEDAAKELGIDQSLVDDIISGKENLTWELIDKATEVWPLNPRDFTGIIDDCPEGILVFRKEQSLRSSRTMYRAKKPYYEYRDTAMSRCSNYRPEWIKELCEVEDNNPDNKNVQWNNGHFMHQFTYFIGPVNFYYLDKNNKKCVAKMNTGDSMYITPFVPHTFTKRKGEDGEAIILAVTYGNFLSGDAKFELTSLGRNKTKGLLNNVSSVESMYSSQVKYFMESLSITREYLMDQYDIDIEEHIDCKQLPSIENIKKLAKSFKVNLRDLIPIDSISDSVVVQKYDLARSWKSGDKGYTFTELASTLSLPYSKSLEIKIHNSKSEFFSTPLHQYFYNNSNQEIVVEYYDDNNNIKKIVLNKDDSFYSKPNTKVSFTGKGLGLLVRIPSRLNPSARDELSFIGEKNIKRIIKEDQQWFNAKGKN